MSQESNAKSGQHPGVTNDEHSVPARLRPGLVLRVQETECKVVIDDKQVWVRFAARFPRPRTERVSPGHLVAVARTSSGIEVIIWRWYDAVVVEEREEQATFWEPAHGEATATRRPSYRSSSAGSRAYVSAGLPGADWWAAGPVLPDPADADIELDEVERLYTEHNLWDGLTPG